MKRALIVVFLLVGLGRIAGADSAQYGRIAEIKKSTSNHTKTSAKMALTPGKHTFRVEKPGYKAWTKEMAIVVGSDLTLDASLA
jgi:hypothetical protein